MKNAEEFDALKQIVEHKKPKYLSISVDNNKWDMTVDGKEFKTDNYEDMLAQVTAYYSDIKL